jgi:photosystem II stability/assembly factor-like uncharacterized protein
MNRTFALSVAVAAACAALGAQSSSVAPDTLKGLPLRSIGPDITTGRISDIDIDPKNPNVWYVASASGGLFKTDNRGNNFTPIFDTGGSFSIGAVKVDPRDSNIVWLGTGENNNQRSVAFGDGVYKSTDAGKTWKRMGLENSEHIQNVVVDPRNSNVVYVSAIGPLWRPGGDRGLFKTTDGGATWKNILPGTENSGATDIVMDPAKPDTIYVAMLQRRRQVGQLVGGGPDSGIFKSTDAGAHFTKLTNGLPTLEMGRVGLGISPKNPKTIYALVTAQRDQGGFFRSDDSGASWTRVGRQANEPGRGQFFGDAGTPTVAPTRTPCGPIGEPMAPPPGGAQGGGRATDDCFRGGDPGYYNEIFVDPQNPETIYSTWTNISKSEDGGKTWKTVPLQGVHVDHHEIVWDPTDHRHVIIGNDGGAYESYDDWKTWRHFTNLPLSQFYRISTDNARPFYNVCGGAQDNGSVEGPSRTTNRAGIRTSDWFNIGGGDGFQCRIDPEDPNTVYAQSQEGNLQRLDLRTGVAVNIIPRTNNVYGMPQADIDAELKTATAGRGGGEENPTPPAAAQPAGAQPAGAQPAGAQPAGRGGQGRGGGRGGAAQRLGRWHWDSPTIVSPHAARRLYFAGDRVYRSDDRGDSWTAVSGDLTRNLDRTKIPIMGKVWPADSVAYMEATTRLSTITALDESPLLEGLLYTGSDDGLIQVTEDGGKNWRKADPIQGVPEFTYVTDVQASPRDANTVFATLNDWNRGNFKPYVVKSADRGRTWTLISGNLPERSGAWSIAQDAVNGNLLFIGMEFGLYATLDGGAHWVKMAGVPTAQVRDITIHRRDGDVVAGTFGRGVFILDDYSALRDVSPEALAEKARLYPLRDAYQFNELNQMEATWGNTTYQNPPYGALFTYSIGQAPAGDQKVALTISDNDGKQVRRIELCPDETAPGLHRIAWDLRPDTPNAPSRCAPQTGRGGFGGRGGATAAVPQARYTATIGTLSGETYTPLGKPVSFAVLPLPAR